MRVAIIGTGVAGSVMAEMLLGDAAHAMVPTLGQGATQAIEDGVLAGAILRAGGQCA